VYAMPGGNCWVKEVLEDREFSIPIVSPTDPTASTSLIRTVGSFVSVVDYYGTLVV